MTAPESIVTSLDWSEKLKEAGWPQDSAFWWCKWTNDKTPPSQEWRLEYVATEYDFVTVTGGAWERFAAPTAEEILRRLPPSLDLDGCYCRLVARKEIHISGGVDKGGWLAGYEGRDTEDVSEFQCGSSLTNAAAAMYCYLAEQKLLPE